MKDVYQTLVLTLILLVLLSIVRHTRQVGHAAEDEDDFSPCVDMVSR